MYKIKTFIKYCTYFLLNSFGEIIYKLTMIINSKKLFLYTHNNVKIIYKNIFIIFIIFIINLEYINGQDMISNLYQQGIYHYSNKNWLAAIDYLGQVCDLNPDHLDARYYLAYSLIMVKKYHEALKHANILISKSPQVKQYIELRDLIMKLVTQPSLSATNTNPKDMQLTKESYTKSILKETPKVSTKIQKEVIITSNSETQSPSTLDKNKKINKSKEVSQKISKLDSILQLIDNREFAQAINLLEELIKKEPKNSKYLHYRGVVEIELKNYTKAINWLKKALEIDKNDFESWFLLGETYIKTNNLKDAESAFEKAVSIKQDPFALINLGIVYRQQNKYNKAIETFEKACKLDSSILEGQINLADTLADYGKLQEASAKINEILTVNPTSASARFIKGKILYHSDMLEDAVSEIKLAVAADPSNAYYNLFLAKVLLKMHRTGEAIEKAASILSDPQFGLEAKLVMAEALMLEGQLADAEAHLNDVEKQANFPQVYRLKGLVAQKRNDTDTAKAMFQKYISTDPNNGYAYLEYANLLETSGDVSSAIEVYKTISSHFPNTTISQKAEEKISTLKASHQSQPYTNANTSPEQLYKSHSTGDY